MNMQVATLAVEFCIFLFRFNIKSHQTMQTYFDLPPLGHLCHWKREIFSCQSVGRFFFQRYVLIVFDDLIYVRFNLRVVIYEKKIPLRGIWKTSFIYVTIIEMGLIGGKVKRYSVLAGVNKYFMNWQT